MPTTTTFAEEFLLLAMGDPEGAFVREPADRLENAIAGALLMDLALKGRIDTDLDGLILVSAEPTGDAVLDQVLALIQSLPQEKNTANWIEEIRFHIERYRDSLVGRLVESGRLKREEKRFLGILPLKRYVAASSAEAEKIRARLRETILGDEIPDPSDVLLISLLVSCNLIDRICTRQERERVPERIEALARMDLIGQAVFKTILRGIVVPVTY